MSLFKDIVEIARGLDVVFPLKLHRVKVGLEEICPLTRTALWVDEKDKLPMLSNRRDVKGMNWGGVLLRVLRVMKDWLVWIRR